MSTLLTAARPSARAPSLPTYPAPGVLRLKLGDAIVTALLDGSLDLPLAHFPRTGEAAAAAMLDREFAYAPIRAALDAFLVQAGGRTALIDSDAANGMELHVRGRNHAAGILPPAK